MIPRSWLFVPGDSEHKLEKTLSSGADAVIIDLEDAVSPGQKPQARKTTAAFLQRHAAVESPAIWVRVNPLSSGFTADDLRAISSTMPTGIVLPKPDSVSDVHKLDDMLTEIENSNGLAPKSTQVLAIVTETARAVGELWSYVDAPGRLKAMSWGAEDLSAELGANDNRDESGEFLFTYKVVRSLFQVASTAAQIPAIETIYADFRNLDGLKATAEQACREGFSGMMAIHPAQVPLINAAFTPSEADLDRARRIVELFADSAGAGVVQLDGSMLDRPHLHRARQLLGINE